MTTKAIALPRTRVAFKKPKLPSYAEVLDYLSAVFHFATTTEMYIDAGREPSFWTWLIALLYTACTTSRWYGYSGAVFAEPLPPLPGRKERFVAGGVLGFFIAVIAVSAGLNMRWIYFLFAVAIMEHFHKPKEST